VELGNYTSSTVCVCARVRACVRANLKLCTQPNLTNDDSRLSEETEQGSFEHEAENNSLPLHCRVWSGVVSSHIDFCLDSSPVAPSKSLILATS
jgi:hypothetical protein